MNFQHRISLENIIQILFSSCFLYFSFPNIIWKEGFLFLNFIWAIPLFFAFYNKTSAQRIILGFCFGAFSFLLLTQWMIDVHIAGWILFASVLMIQVLLFSVFAFTPTKNQWVNALYFSCLWAFSEYLRTVVCGGFAWGVGYGLSFFPWLIQGASFGGVYFVSAFILGVNYLVFATLQTRACSRHYLYGAYVLVIAVMVLGMIRIVYSDLQVEKSYQISVGVVQANIIPSQKLDINQYNRNIKKHMRLTKKAALMGDLSLVVWPETAFVDDVLMDLKWRPRIEQMAQNLRTHLLIGSASLIDDKDYNSAVFIDAAGQLRGVYHKQKLVPFREQSFLKQSSFNIIKKLNMSGYDFVPGNKLGIMDIDYRFGQDVYQTRFGIGICSETAYPYLYRKLKKHNAAFAVSMLNDGWFNQKAALMMHAQFDIFRAVENNLSIVRSANTGLSGLIDYSGRFSGKHRLKLMSQSQGAYSIRDQIAQTFYSKNGDIFAQICGVFVILIFGINLGKKLFNRKLYKWI